MRCPGFGLYFLICVLTANFSLAEPYHLAPESTLWIEGDSTLHAFRITAESLDMKLDITRVIQESEPVWLLNSWSTSIPVLGLESGKSKMNSKIRECLKANAFSLIEGLFQSTDGVMLSGQNHHLLTMTLRVAGVSKNVDLSVWVENLSLDKITLSGTKTLKMSDFGIKPPVFMGMLKTMDEVKVSYQLVFTPPSTRG